MFVTKPYLELDSSFVFLTHPYAATSIFPNTIACIYTPREDNSGWRGIANEASMPRKMWQSNQTSTDLKS